MTLVAFGFGFSVRDLSVGQAPSGAAFAALVHPGAVHPVNPYELFQSNFNSILGKYRRKVDPTRLRYAAMEGLVASLGDPHTNFMEPRVAESFTTETRGDFVGIGARLGTDPMGAKIATVFHNSPAERAGVKANDTIVSVNGVETSGVEVEKIVEHIKGQAGTTVKVGILRTGSPSPLILSIIRAKVVVPTSEGKMLPGNVGYVSVTQFSEPTPAQFADALREVKSHNPAGLIIDMRGNPGGLLDAALQMLGDFVDGKPGVTMRGRNGLVDSKNTTSGQTLGFKCPIAILVNEDSASAAEIFSGVMKDYHMAVLIGEHTYGKASVQTTHIIPQDLALVKVTIAHYYLPGGENMSRKVDEDGVYQSGGLKPDVAVALKITKDTLLGDPGKDSQLDRALEYVKNGK